MKVKDLLDVLRGADPDATVILLPEDETDESDGQEVRSAYPGGMTWTRERGVSKGRPYESLYPGGPHCELRYDCEQVAYETVPVVVLGAKERV